ncbi:2-oxo-4-hydroxy-4-carboxy-5-ureidoimidazoline decarboxylase [Bacillus sp. YZJH907-2]|uniref:2-oxo-4-hydroxy-4-carboxy-5-ureidoimidazoline decarboxylase n=2 Tax=Halalkalibacter suaedae TaxID=2822140 RepID=A0A940X0X7_9BACI|nr:2-oxo-4-hydroxy-4-carboxy-5-ureidoimidazoline decarboxylase [Bacillus suaedae]
MISMAEVNEMSKEEFVKTVGVVFEHSPWVAERTWKHHPFDNANTMYMLLIEEMNKAEEDRQLSLLRSHPDLGTRLEISEASTSEQKGAGLNELTEEEFKKFSRLNHVYVDTFGFPFILAVRGHTKESIQMAMEQRIANTVQEERKTALTEVSKIAKFRLDDMIEQSFVAES